MRILYYVPILHNPADFGNISDKVQKKGKEMVGEEGWKRHLETINGFWNSIKSFEFDNTKKLKIFQDSFCAEPNQAERIVQELAEKGSRNYQVIKGLMEKGAVLLKTEDIVLVKKEADLVKNLINSKNIFSKIINYLKYKLEKGLLLRNRDEFISKTINNVLGEDETGLLFLGAFHNVLPLLEKDTKVIQLKKREKVLQYQQSYYLKSRQELVSRLEHYLQQPVKV